MSSLPGSLFEEKRGSHVTSSQTRKALGLCVKGAGGPSYVQLGPQRLLGLKRLVQRHSKLMEDSPRS